MSFHSGQHVVCVNGDLPQGAEISNGGEPWPLREGVVYTVKEVAEQYGICPDGAIGFSAVLLLEEIPGDFGRWDLGYDATRFRPLSETRLDQFRAHLAPTPRAPVSA